MLILLAVLAWISSSSIAAVAAATTDEITNFATTVTAQPDSTLDIKEDITVRFNTPNRHGIDRFIPTVYERVGNNYSVELKLQDVTGANGQYIQHKASQQGRDLFIRIGDPKRTIMGLQQYHIHYTLRRAINFFDEGPEIYINLTGNEWRMPIDAVVAHVVFPPVQDKSEIRARSFIGEEGSTMTYPYSLELDNAKFTCGRLEPGEGLTAVVGLPPGSIKKPTHWQEFLYLVSDWWPLAVLPALTFSICFIMWWYLGRDAAKRQALAVDWEPPKDLSPAEVGTLIDEKCDLSDMVSTVVDLAARGYITIREFKTDSLFFLRNKDYEFTRLPQQRKASQDTAQCL